MIAIWKKILKAASLAFLAGFMSLWSFSLMATTLCGTYQTCKPESQHSASVVQMLDGMGNIYYAYDVDSAGLIPVANQACAYYAAAHSNAQSTMTFDPGSCMPVLPVPDSNVGGQFVPISVTGTYKQVRSDGVLLASGPWTGGLLNAGCGDSLNANLVSAGSNGQCYCNNGLNWSPSLNACVAVYDHWYNASSKNSLICEARFGKPIAPLVGAKILKEDLGISVGRESLGIVFDSRKNVPYVASPTIINGVAAVAASPAASFGSTWASTVHKSLYIQRNGTSSIGYSVQAYRGDGQFETFNHPSVTVYTPSNSSVIDQMVPVLDGQGNQTSQVRIIDPKGNIELYDMYNQLTGWKGDLLSITYVDGGSINYTYSTSTTPINIAPSIGLLIGISDNQGRNVQFQYDQPSSSGISARIKRLTTPEGRVITFGYDANNNLSQINWPDGKVRNYLYERSDLVWAVTGIVDENNSRLSGYTYDSQGRAIGTELSGGVNSYSASYGTPPFLSVTENRVGSVITREHKWVEPQGVTITLPNGTSSSLSIASINGMPVMSGQTQPAGSGCAETNNATVYDAVGNVLSQDNFQGQRTCYAYDSSNREIVRVEGLANTVTCSTVTPTGATLPVGARKTSTSWHPDWRLPARVTQPGLTSTLVYNGQVDPFNFSTASCTTAANLPNGKPMPLVCKQVSQATAEVLAVPPAPVDPYINSVTVLLHGDGYNNSTAVVDSSPAPKTVTVGGSAKISTVQSVFGGSSLLFGSSNYPMLTVANISGNTFWQSDWTTEFFALTANPTTSAAAIFGNRFSGGGGTLLTSYSSGVLTGLSIQAFSGGAWVGWGVGTGTPGFTAAASAAGAFNHVAITKQGKTYTFFLNGVMLPSVTTTYQISSALTTNIYVGSADYGWIPYNFSGYIDEFRITQGVIRYTASFTPPAAAYAGYTTSDPSAPTATSTFTYDASGRVLTSVDANNRTTGYAYYSDTAFSGNPPGSYDPDIDMVPFLLHGNGVDGATSIVDDSPYHRTVTPSGNARISTAQSKFGGSSIAFDGVGDYLSIPYNADFAFGAGEFTIETFVYKNANNTNGSRIWNSNGDYYDGVAVYIDPNGNFGVYVSTNGTSWTQSLPVVANLTNGQWYHLAITRSGGSIFAFVNGVKYTVTTALGTSPLYTNTGVSRVIGGQIGVDRALNGYIDEFRITKGKARYTANFTPPTQEFLNNGLVLNIADIGHSVGDLQSITNAAGHVTQFTQYDRAGRVRQMIDAKGVVTDTTYTPRGWVASVTTTAPGGVGRTTSYTYDSVGQLTQVSQPDGTTLGYSYDAAHRLVGVTDARGNAISYTLDNVGNRIAEEVRDPTGALQRSISRSFDALNRLQQVSGAAQ